MFLTNLTPLRHEHSGLYISYFAQSNTEIADSYPNSRFAWNVGYRYHFQEISDCLVLLSDGGIFCDPHVTLPLGSLDAFALTQIIKEVLPRFEDCGHTLRFMFVDESHLRFFNEVATAQGYAIRITHDEDYSDYIYDADALRTLKGRSYRPKRNHVNQFERMYAGYEFSPVKPADKLDCLALVQAWCANKQIDCANPLESDCIPMTRLFDSMDVLDVRGGVIRVGGQIVAFALGSLARDGKSAVIHFEKANPTITGVYAVINQMVLSEIFPQIEYINREEDMGIDGLRTAKESYNPIRKQNKYSVFIERNKL